MTTVRRRGKVRLGVREQAGHLLATDIDPRFLLENAALRRPQITIQRHDVVADPVPTERFDLIHGRLVTAPIPSQPHALAQMVSALKPGGRLVLDEYDVALIDQTYPTADAASAALYRKMRAAQDELMRRRGVDLAWGGSLYQRMREHGLVDVHMDGTVTVYAGGDPGTRLMRANYEQIRDEAVVVGLVSQDDIEQVLHPIPKVPASFWMVSHTSCRVPRLKKIWSDAAYRGKELADWRWQQGAGWELAIVEREPGTRGFAVQPRRWVVERSFAWISRNRRLAKDDERKVQTSETLIDLASIRLLLGRLAEREKAEAVLTAPSGACPL